MCVITWRGVERGYLWMFASRSREVLEWVGSVTGMSDGGDGIGRVGPG